MAPSPDRARYRRATHVDGRRAARADAHRPPTHGRRPAPARRDRPLSSSLAALLDGDPDEVVIYAGEIVTTRGELRALVDRFTETVRAADLAGRAIGVFGRNEPATVAAWFAVWNSGGAFVPLNPRVPAVERDRAIEITGIAGVFDSATGELRRVAPAEPRVLAGNEAIIQFTSGTTGRPKAVPLRHDTIQGLLDAVIGTLRGGQPGER